MGTEALTPQEIAALQAGIVLNQPVVQTVAAVPVVAPPPAAAQVAAPPPAAAASAAAPAAPDQSALVAYLQGQVVSMQASLTAAQVEAASLKGQLTAAQAVQPGLMAIVSASINTMALNLDGHQRDLSAMSAEALMAEHGRMAERFTAQYKSGGVAASARVVAAAQAAAGDEVSIRAARLRATGLK